MSSTAAASVESPPSHVRAAAAAESFDDDVCEMLLMATQVVCRTPMKQAAYNTRLGHMQSIPKLEPGGIHRLRVALLSSATSDVMFCSLLKTFTSSIKTGTAYTPSPVIPPFISCHVLLVRPRFKPLALAGAWQGLMQATHADALRC
jgi:hypothetical protein